MTGMRQKYLRLKYVLVFLVTFLPRFFRFDTRAHVALFGSNIFPEPSASSASVFHIFAYPEAQTL
jgi:hypothetical protein